jgi:ParB-like nuclease family protein
MNTATTLDIDFVSIHLDLNNPRIPEGLRGKEESTILEHLWHNEVLIELVQSMLVNGFFRQEPLVVKQLADGSYVALEGNRRLGALKIIHKDPIAIEIPALDPLPNVQQLNRLKSIPCVVVENSDEVRKYLGFRHISGLRRWAPEAKARYVLEEVRALANSGDTNPFASVARRVGSNTVGIRNSFLAISILLHSRKEFGLNVSEVQQTRFGVWLRCMNSAEIREHIGMGLPRTYGEISEALNNINKDGLQEVLEDLAPGGNARPVLTDSRDVTVYGKVLRNDHAYKRVFP